MEILDEQGRIVLVRGVIGRSVTAASGANWIRLVLNLTTTSIGVLGEGLTYKARIKAVRESDNVVSYSDMWPCELYVQPPPNVGGD